MALSAKSRSTLFETLSPLVGDEATEEMLSYFPARDVEEPVTKEHLDRRLAEVETKIAELRHTMSEEFRSQQRWMIGLAGAFSTVIVLADKFIH